MAFSCETASADLLQGLKRLVDERGVCLTLHHQSGVAERKRYHEAYGTSPTEYLERLGVLGPNVMLAHVLGLSPAEVDAVARTGTNVVMCPTSAMKEAKGLHLVGNLPEFVEKGVNVAFGSDSANSLQPPGRDPLDQPGGAPVQGRAPGPRRDPGRDGARDGHAARRRRRSRSATTSARSSPARRPTSSSSTPTARSGRRCSTRSTTWSTTPTAAASTPSSSTARWSWRAGSRASWTPTGCTARSRRSARASRPGPASRSRAAAGPSSDAGRGQAPIRR